MKKTSFEEHCLWDLMLFAQRRYANSLTERDYDLFIDSAKYYWEEHQCYNFVIEKLFHDVDLSHFY